MRIDDHIARAFLAPEFQSLVENFLRSQKLIPAEDPNASLSSKRFLTRSVVPHVEKLSDLFNRQTPESELGGGVDTYWRKSSNPANLRLAYFLSFMPGNLFRTLSVFAELSRLGFQWKFGGRAMRAIEFGAGPASGACGVAAAASLLPQLQFPEKCDWTLVERDRAVLGLGCDWATRFFTDWCKRPAWQPREDHRTLDWAEPLRKGPKYDLLLFSFALNESRDSPEFLAHALLKLMRVHLAEEGLLVLVEQALKLQSRRLLEIRRELLKLLAADPREADPKLLTPCLGTQLCGALADPEDWCHEEATWWRPPFLKLLDELTKLDRKTLPFTHQVWMKSNRTLPEILPSIGPGTRAIHRLVSPARKVGRDHEFFVCGQDGKRRARLRTDAESQPDEAMRNLSRGDLLLDAEVRGNFESTRIESVKNLA